MPEDSRIDSRQTTEIPFFGAVSKFLTLLDHLNPKDQPPPDKEKITRVQNTIREAYALLEQIERLLNENKDANLWEKIGYRLTLTTLQVVAQMKVFYLRNVEGNSQLESQITAFEVEVANSWFRYTNRRPWKSYVRAIDEDKPLVFAKEKPRSESLTKDQGAFLLQFELDQAQQQRLAEAGGDSFTAALAWQNLLSMRDARRDGTSFKHMSWQANNLVPLPDRNYFYVTLHKGELVKKVKVTEQADIAAALQSAEGWEQFDVSKEKYRQAFEPGYYYSPAKREQDLHDEANYFTADIAISVTSDRRNFAQVKADPHTLVTFGTPMAIQVTEGGKSIFFKHNHQWIDGFPAQLEGKHVIDSAIDSMVGEAAVAEWPTLRSFDELTDLNKQTIIEEQLRITELLSLQDEIRSVQQLFWQTTELNEEGKEIKITPRPTLVLQEIKGHHELVANYLEKFAKVSISTSVLIEIALAMTLGSDTKQFLEMGPDGEVQPVILPVPVHVQDMIRGQSRSEQAHHSAMIDFVECLWVFQQQRNTVRAGGDALPIIFDTISHGLRSLLERLGKVFDPHKTAILVKNLAFTSSMMGLKPPAEVPGAKMVGFVTAKQEDYSDVIGTSYVSNEEMKFTLVTESADNDKYANFMPDFEKNLGMVVDFMTEFVQKQQGWANYLQAAV